MIEYKEMKNYFELWRLFYRLAICLCFLGFFNFNLSWARDAVTIRAEIEQQKDQLAILEFQNTNAPSKGLKMQIKSTGQRIKSLEEELQGKKSDHAIKADSGMPPGNTLPNIRLAKHTGKVLRRSGGTDDTTPDDEMATLVSGSDCLAPAGGTVFPRLRGTVRDARDIARRVP